jgi:predicted pyridoxine 5'-phosphate oxidase superfamily flavin-nucleotide-binding protein
MPSSGQALDVMATSLIAQCDTLFVGSADSQANFDASHRGGLPGFVDQVSDTQLRIPDYHGNSMFNTLGNFHVNAKAGLLFIDLKRNIQLHLTGKVSIEFDNPSHIEKSGGTGRWWTFDIKAWRTSPLAHSASWRFVDNSPFNPKD